MSFWDEDPWGRNCEEPISSQEKAEAEAKAKLFAEIDAKRKAEAEAKAKIEAEADAEAEIEFPAVKEEVVKDYNKFFDRELSSGECYTCRSRKGYEGEFGVLRKYTLVARVRGTDVRIDIPFKKGYWKNPRLGMVRKIVRWLNENAIHENRFVRIEE